MENSKQENFEVSSLIQFQQFSRKKKKEKCQVDFYDILPIGIYIIGFNINIISDFVFINHFISLSTSYFFGR